MPFKPTSQTHGVNPKISQDECFKWTEEVLVLFFLFFLSRSEHKIQRFLNANVAQ